MTNTFETVSKRNTKELLSIEANALRLLHEVRGYNFEKPHSVIKLSGSWTARQVRDNIQFRGYKADTSECMLVIIEKPSVWGSRRPYLAELNADGDKVIGWKYDEMRDNGVYRSEIRANFDSFCRKLDFEKVRKEKTDRVFVIVQKNDDLCPNSLRNFEKPLTGWERWRVVRDTYTRSYGWQTQLRVSVKQENGGITSRTFFGSKEQTPADIIDKSGYCIGKRREELKNAAKQRRADKARAEYEKIDFTKEGARLADELKASRAAIVEFIATAESAHDFTRSVKMLSELKNAAQRLDDFNSRNARKDYASKEEAGRAADRIRENLAKARLYLDSISPADIHEAAAAILPATDFDHHGSDLYIKWSSKAKELMNRLSTRSLLTIFRDNTPTRDLWYELPLCYNERIGRAQEAGEGVTV